MKNEMNHPVLQQPIADLEMSEEFKTMAAQNDYGTIAEILTGPLSELPAAPGSGYRMLRELIAFLTLHGLEEVVED